MREKFHAGMSSGRNFRRLLQPDIEIKLLKIKTQKPRQLPAGALQTIVGTLIVLLPAALALTFVIRGLSVALAIALLVLLRLIALILLLIFIQVFLFVCHKNSCFLSCTGVITGCPDPTTLRLNLRDRALPQT
jgi:hypothetical protein